MTSRIKEGTHALDIGTDVSGVSGVSGPVLETLVSTEDGSVAYRYTGVVSSWDDAMREPADDVEWSCEPDTDSDDAEISMPVEQWARLVQLARIGREYSGCDACRRSTAA